MQKNTQIPFLKILFDNLVSVIADKNAETETDTIKPRAVIEHTQRSRPSNVEKQVNNNIQSFCFFLQYRQTHTYPRRTRRTNQSQGGLAHFTNLTIYQRRLFGTEFWATWTDRDLATMMQVGAPALNLMTSSEFVYNFWGSFGSDDSAQASVRGFIRFHMENYKIRSDCSTHSAWISVRSPSMYKKLLNYIRSISSIYVSSTEYLHCNFSLMTLKFYSHMRNIR